MARVVVNIPDSVDLSKVNDIKLCIRYCKDNDEYSYVTDGFSIQEERPHGEWSKWIIAEVQCPNCFKYFELDYCPTGELNKCPNCGAENGIIRLREN